MKIEGKIDAEDANDVLNGQFETCIDCGGEYDVEVEIASFRGFTRKHNVALRGECDDCGEVKELRTSVYIELEVAGSG